MWDNLGKLMEVAILPMTATIMGIIVDHIGKRRLQKEITIREEIQEELEKRVDKKDVDTQEAVKALLRNEIIDKYHEFIVKGYVDIYSRDSINRMYTEYKNLRGNSTVDDLMISLKELPTISEEELIKLREEKQDN